jgi:hypothetical protein
MEVHTYLQIDVLAFNNTRNLLKVIEATKPPITYKAKEVRFAIKKEFT